MSILTEEEAKLLGRAHAAALVLRSDGDPDKLQDLLKQYLDRITSKHDEIDRVYRDMDQENLGQVSRSMEDTLASEGYYPAAATVASYLDDGLVAKAYEIIMNKSKEQAHE